MTEETKAEPVVRFGDWQANLAGKVIRIPIVNKDGRVYSKTHDDRAAEETQYGWFLFLNTRDGWCKLGGTDFRNATRWLNGEPLKSLDFLSVVWHDNPPEEEKKRGKR